MALITCADCGNQVSDNAIACPQCGAPPQSPQRIQHRSADSHQQSRNLSSPAPVWLSAVVAVLLPGVAIGVIVYISSSSGSRKKRAAQGELLATGAAPTEGVPGAADPWIDRAEAAVTDILNANGQTIAISILGIIHPYGLPDRLLRSEVRREGDGLSVRLKIGWEAAHGDGYQTTLVTWDFDEQGHRHAQASNSSGFRPAHPEGLDAYFRDSLYPQLRQKTGD